MGITIHQSLYGDKDGGYALLKTTLPDVKLAKKMGNSTDLSDRPSQGVIWEPAVRGFKHGIYYLIMKTYNTPHIRLGRVFSHVLIIENTDLAQIKDLGQLFGLFQSELDTRIELEPFIYDTQIAVRSNETDARIIHAAEGLVSSKSVVWIGQAGFEDAVKTIWANLWNKAKLSFQFGIQFNPTATKQEESHLFCTPESLTIKWREADYYIVSSGESVMEITKSAEYLLDPNKIPSLKKFINAVGKEPNSFRQLSLLEKGLNTFDHLATTEDFNELFSLYTILTAINANNSDLIGSIIKRIAAVIPNASLQSVNALRKLKINNIPDLVVTELKDALAKWLDKHLLNLTSTTNLTNYRLVINIAATDSEKWWVESINKALHIKVDDWKTSYAKIIWDWLDGNPEQALPGLESLFLKKEGVNLSDKLADSFPKNISEQLDELLTTFSLNNALYWLHARLLIYKISPTEVIPAYLAIEPDKNDDTILRNISTCIVPEIFVADTIKVNDTRLEVISTQLIKKKKGLLKDIDLSNPIWQRLLAAVIEKPQHILNYFSKPEKNLVYPIFDLLVANKLVNEKLLLIIGNSEYADLKNYNNRGKVWDIIPVSVKSLFLQKTAVNYFEAQVSEDEEIEPELKAALSSQETVSTILNKHREYIGPVLHFFETINNLQERSLQDYLYYYRKPLNSVEAVRLGKIVKTRQWRNCLGIIQERARSNEIYKIAFQECTDMLGWLAYGQAALQGMISKVEIKENDWWDQFETLAPQLYPEGPTDKKVWKKSGGEEADLLHKGDGREIWQDAIAKLKFGRIKNNFLTVLLDRMARDFPYNEQLKILITLRNKV